AGRGGARCGPGSPRQRLRSRPELKERKEDAKAMEDEGRRKSSRGGAANFTLEQLNELESFSTRPIPTVMGGAEPALGLSEARVQVWFQNVAAQWVLIGAATQFEACRVAPYVNVGARWRMPFQQASARSDSAVPTSHRLHPHLAHAPYMMFPAPPFGLPLATLAESASAASVVAAAPRLGRPPAGIFSRRPRVSQESSRRPGRVTALFNFFFFFLLFFSFFFFLASRKKGKEKREKGFFKRKKGTRERRTDGRYNI
uniref:Homeobox domain-containing protein n=1 Tax=Malurus cyaneus samueli TaxID=2593467 RepID=A0A8C5TYD5_9PASS